MQVGKLLSIEKGKEEELFAEMDNDGKHNAYQDYAFATFHICICQGGGDISWDEFLLFFSQRLNQY